MTDAKKIRRSPELGMPPEKFRPHNSPDFQDNLIPETPTDPLASDALEALRKLRQKSRE